MYLIGIFASPIPYLAILGIYLSGFAYIKFWPAQAEEDFSGEDLAAEVVKLSESFIDEEVTLLIEDFSESYFLSSSQSLIQPIEFTCKRYPFFNSLVFHFAWPLQYRVRPPPVG